MLRELGYPTDLPPLPKGLDALLQSPLPGDWGAAARYARIVGIPQVLKSKLHWGVGVGRDAMTGGPSIVFLARRREKASAASRLPESAEIEDRKFPVEQMVLSPNTLRHTGLAPAFFPDPRALVRNTGSGGFTGCAISSDPQAVTAGIGGTLSGVFTSIAGSSLRGVTCAHVALDLGIANLLNNLPGSLGILFRSPSGRRMYVAGDPNIGQSIYELFRVDTPWPMLTPAPFALMPGSLSFLYVDIAAGPVRLTQVPGFQPPPPGLPQRRRTIFNAQLDHGTFPIPGADVYKTGQSTGLTWGSCIVSSLFIPIPIPLLPVIVLFWVNLHRLAIAPGDSGCLVAGNPGQELYDIDGLGLGGTALTGPRSINSISIGLPFPVASLFAGIRN